MRLVIGFGNPLRGDDGLGPAVAEAVRERRGDLTTLTPHQLLPELAATLACVEQVVFVDAGRGDQAGVVTCEWLRAGGDAHVDHVLSPAALLRLTADAFGADPPAWLVRIDGLTFDLGAALSSPARAAIPRAVELIQQLIPAR